MCCGLNLILFASMKNNFEFHDESMHLEDPENAKAPKQSFEINFEGEFKKVKMAGEPSVIKKVCSKLLNKDTIALACFLILIALYCVLYIITINFNKCQQSFYLDCRIIYKVRDFLDKVYLTSGCGLILSMILAVLYFWRSKSAVILLVIVNVILFCIDRGYTLTNHGGYIRNGVLITSCFFFIVQVILIQTIRFILKYQFKAFLLVISVVLCILYLSFYYIFTYSCRDFKKGFKGIEYSNADPQCMYPVPPYCSFVIFDGILDLPRWFNQQCRDEPGNLTLLLRENDNLKAFANLPNLDMNDIANINRKLGTAINGIAFPRTEKVDRKTEAFYGSSQSYILNRLINLNEIEDEKSSIYEYFIKYNNKTNQYEPILDLKYNETLAAERKKTFDEVYKRNAEEVHYKSKTQQTQTDENGINKDETMLSPLTKNVLVFFSDATSRRHFFRKYEKLTGFLERNYKNETSKLSSYQFMKHHTIYPGTLANIGAAYFGTFNRNNGYSYIKKFKDFGFITGSTHNICTPEVIDIKSDEVPNYDFTEVDHDLWAPFCDPNQLSLKGPYVDFKGPYSILKRCMWGKNSFEYSIEYARQFFSKYKDSNKFFRIGTSDSHETSAEMIKYNDEYITNLLEELEADGTLEDTTVLIFSDHGTYSWGWVHRSFETADYEYEMNLPGLFMLMPKRINNFEKIDSNMHSRNSTLTTAFDIYKTLISVLDGKEDKQSFTNYGEGLFYNSREMVKRNDRNKCKDLGIRDEHCMCKDAATVINP